MTIQLTKEEAEWLESELSERTANIIDVSADGVLLYSIIEKLQDVIN